jgi:peptidoglycan/LPS O-acetylase OafA/YrhL
MISSIYNKFRRITSNHLYFPEIDGIRFVAILLVILFHTHGYFAEKSTSFSYEQKHTGLLNKFLENGDRGVELFFVLSGFILCLPFAQQYLKRGKKMLLKKYYLRRLTRLEPPYFIAMTLIFLVQVMAKTGPLNILMPHWLASLIYSHDLIYHHTPLITVVAWSLEIEIQFYLVAPFLFRILELPATARRMILLLAIILIICYQVICPPVFLNITGFAQYFFTGILLADFYVNNTAAEWFNRKWVIPASLLCFIIVCYLPLKNPLLPAFQNFVTRLSLCLSIGLFYYMILKNSSLRKLFSFRFVPIIGGMCYSIYLLHYSIISFAGRFIIKLPSTGHYLPDLLLQVVLLCIPVLIISSIFYYFIERPFMSSRWMDMLLKKDKNVS